MVLNGKGLDFGGCLSYNRASHYVCVCVCFFFLPFFKSTTNLQFDFQPKTNGNL